MIDSLERLIETQRKSLYLLFRQISEKKRAFLLSSDIRDVYDAFVETEPGRALRGSVMERIVYASQECAVQDPWIYFFVRWRVGEYAYLRFHTEDILVQEVSPSAFLQFKENLIHPEKPANAWTLELDMLPFSRGFPRLKEPRSIGYGVQFLNRVLTNRMFTDLELGGQALLDFLRVHHYNGKQLMLRSRMETTAELRQAVRSALAYLSNQPAEAEWDMIGEHLQDLGLLPGWGRTAKQIAEMLKQLSDLLEAPEAATLEKFLERIPMIFRLVIVSPHGYFGQTKVLGLPDTGGQVVYILNQVRALEKTMLRQIRDQGLDIKPEILVVTRLIPEAGNTTCDQRVERIIGCKYAKILRVPFREKSGDILRHWVSRFQIYPYLEQFALDAESEIQREMGSRPDLIIGNYTDGNLVAYLLAQRLGVTQCNIAHALEKSKYLFSAMYWKENEAQYHFETQFTADLIAMNAADFIITSTYQEIAGGAEGIGQYESYANFTMPDLYRVVKGIDVFDPKFNIVSPGADGGVYFPYKQKNKRLTELHEELNRMVFGTDQPDSRGRFAVESKPIIFTMARLDYIKNITGLVDWYGRSEKLREQANLLVVAGYVDAAQSQDEEEKRQIALMHDLMNRYQLDGQVRWLGLQLEKNIAGELYRFVADRRGVFVQPALFEAFGLTVVEAMICGLPTFATRYGGPLEIIEHEISGFHIDPNRGDKVAEAITHFFAHCGKDPQCWQKISDGGIKRVLDRYTWELYANRLLSLSRIYGFWKFISKIEREETSRYLEMFYNLMFKRLAENIS